MEQTERYIKIEANENDYENASITARDLPVGTIVVRNGDVWEEIGEVDYTSAVAGAITISDIAVLVAHSGLAGTITLGQDRQHHLTSVPWQPCTIIRFTKDFNMKGPITRFAESLTNGNYLTLRGGVLRTPAAGATSRCWAIVTKDQSVSDGDIEITTTGMPYDVAVA